MSNSNLSSAEVNHSELKQHYWTYNVQSVVDEIHKHRFVCLLGQAGAGKTTCAIRALAEEAKGHSVFIISNSRKCLKNLKYEFESACRDIGIDPMLLDVSYITNFKMCGYMGIDPVKEYGITKNSIVFIDEAGFVMTDGFSDSIDDMVRQKAKLIVAGDIAQYSAGPWYIQVLSFASNIDEIAEANRDDPFYQAYLGTEEVRRLLRDATNLELQRAFDKDETMRPYVIQLKTGDCPWSKRFDKGFIRHILPKLIINPNGYYLVSSPDQTDPKSLGRKISLAIQAAKAELKDSDAEDSWHPNAWFYPVFRKDKFVIKCNSPRMHYQSGDVLQYISMKSENCAICYNIETSLIVDVPKEHWRYVFNEQVTSAQNCQGTREWKRPVYAVLNMGPYLTADLLNLIETRACGDIYFIIRNKADDTICSKSSANRYLSEIHGNPSIFDKMSKSYTGGASEFLTTYLRSVSNTSDPCEGRGNMSLDKLDLGADLNVMWYRGSPLNYVDIATLSKKDLSNITRQYLKAGEDIREIIRFVEKFATKRTKMRIGKWRETISDTVRSCLPCGKYYEDFVYFFERWNTHTPDNRYNRIKGVASFCVYNPIFFGQDSYKAIADALKDYDDPIFLEWFEKCYYFFKNVDRSDNHVASDARINKAMKVETPIPYEEIESTKLTEDEMNLAICSTYPAMKKELLGDAEEVPNCMVTVKKPDGRIAVGPWLRCNQHQYSYTAAVSKVKRMKTEAPENEYWLTKVLPGTNTVVIDCDGDPAMTEAFNTFCKERGINPLMMTSPTDPNRWHAYGATTVKFRPIHADKLKWKSDILTNSIEFLKDKVPSGEDFLVGKDLADWLRMMDANNQS